MASIRETIEIAGCIDPTTVEVVRELEEYNHDCFPLAKDWSGKVWLVQQETVPLPEDSITERGVLRFMAEQRMVLPEWKRSWLLGPAYQVVYNEDKPPATELVENQLGLWIQLRDVEPADKGVWDYITWRRLSTDTNLLGQYQVGDQGSNSTMVR